jgi:hypothetical protein
MKNSNTIANAFLLVFLNCCFLTACTSMENENTVASFNSPNAISMNYGNQSDNQITNSPSNTTSVIMDKGLNIPLGRIVVPKGWTLRQNIISTTHTAGFQAFQLELHGPNDELIMYLPLNVQYMKTADFFTGQMQGYGFEELAQYLVSEMLREKSQGLTAFGFQVDRKTQQDPQFRKMEAEVRQLIGSLTPHEFQIKGQYKGKCVQGSGIVLQVDYSQNLQGMGTAGVLFNGAIVIATPDRLSQTLKLSETVQLEFNPQWDQAKDQIIRNDTDRMTASHNARMANQKASFNAQQQAYHQTQAAYQSQNDAWYHNNLGAGSQYNSSAAFTDAITGHTSFQDPYTGHQIKQEGHYNHWYTNQHGEYYGTDDASFNPATLQGDWQAIEPLGGGN